MTNFPRVFLRLAAILLLGLGLVGHAAEPVEVGLLHINDVYQIAPIDPKAPRGGLARLATLAREIKRAQPATLLVFGGDTLSPSIESGLFQGKQMIAAWNAVGIDLAVPGNHEFDFGEIAFRAALADSAFPWLAANLHAATPLPKVVPGVLRELGGVKLGFVGLLTPDTATLSKPGPGLRFEELEVALRREAAALKAQGAVAIVALTHNNLDEDRRLAATGLVDLILGGHEHHPIAERVQGRPILKAGSDVRDVIHARLRFERGEGATRLREVVWDLLPLDGRWAEDAAVLAVAADYERQVAGLLTETIGETAVPLDALGETLRTEESNIGNFAADAVRAAMNADIALLNGGGFRIDRIVELGPLSRRDLLALLPFQNPLVLLSITGAQLRAALEHGIDRRVSRGQSGAFPHVSGLRLRYDPKAAAGTRIVDLTVGGKPLDPQARYTLATSNYLAGGGDGYAMLQGLPVLRPAEGSPSETEVLIDAVRHVGRIAPTVDGRLAELP